MALEVAGSKPVTRPIIRFRFETKRTIWGMRGVCPQADLKALVCNGSLAGVAELVDALVLGTSGESRGGSSPSARTIGACRYFDGVTALTLNASPQMRNSWACFAEVREENKGIDGSMNVSETKSDGLLREYKIVITADEIEGEVTKKLEEIAATVKMPGFRPGKVPLSVVKTRFGDQARGEAIKTALDEGARQAIEGNDLKLASQPKVDIKSYEERKDLEASLACEIMPAITVPNLAELTIEKPRMERATPRKLMMRLSRIADENRPTAALPNRVQQRSGTC